MTRRPSVQATTTPQATACIEGRGWLLPTGYKQCRVDGKRWLSHRYAWVEAIGPIPDGLCVLHHCDNRRCANTEHMFLGTIADNNRDMHTKGRGGGPHFGEDHHNAKLSTDQVVEIRRAAASGGWGVQARLARQFGVSPVTIHDIVHRKLWN